MSNQANFNSGVAEALFVAKACSFGWDVCKPFGHAQAYDFVIRKDGKWQTVQVKKAYAAITKRKTKNGTSIHHYMAVNLRKGDGRSSYQAGEFDLLCVVEDAIKIWLIPWEELKKTTGISIHSSKYNTYRI